MNLYVFPELLYNCILYDSAPLSLSSYSPESSVRFVQYILAWSGLGVLLLNCGSPLQLAIGYNNLVDIGIIEYLINTLSKYAHTYESKHIRTILNGFMCLSKLCCENLGRCLRLGAEGTRIFVIFLMRFQTQLCDQEHILESDWTKSEQIFENWHPLHALVACAIESVHSCIANCSENRALFVQHGGFTILLNLLEVFINIKK
ncbi:hypothetical protein ACTXT7_001624 [Hymenolepis weldensis]